MKDFAKLGLKSDIVQVLRVLGYKEPLEVQQEVIPLEIQGHNIVFTSKTGSGKTLAYTAGYLGKINIKQGVQMLIIVPTRELCIQVGKEVKRICTSLNINVGVLYGGRMLGGDHKTTSRRNQIYVCTPGRIIQHINEKNIKVGDVKCIVYDESDQMFDNGFYSDCTYLKKRISSTAQIILASATITKQVHKFMGKEIRTYKLLRIGSPIPKGIVQEKIYCKISEKDDIILKIIKEKKLKKTMIFCNTKIKTEYLMNFLKENKIDAKPVSGSLDQKERENYINLFKANKIDILIATDVAARGLHIEDVDAIINFDVPTRDEFYIHRIGRSGRNDKKGYSMTLVCEEDVERFAKLCEDNNLEVKEVKKDDDFSKNPKIENKN